MRATSVLYLDSLDYQRDLFPSVASTALARMASAFAHVRNISNNVAIVTSSAIHDKLNKRLIEKIQLTDDDKLLEEASRLLEVEIELSDVYIINDKQREAIEEGKKQIINGAYLSDEESNKEIDEWLSK